MIIAKLHSIVHKFLITLFMVISIKTCWATIYTDLNFVDNVCTIAAGDVVKITGNLTIQSYQKIIVHGTLIDTLGSITNMGNIEIVSEGSSVASVRVTGTGNFINGNDQGSMSTQGRVLLTNGVLKVGGIFYVGSDNTKLNDKGIIVDGTGDSYFVVGAMKNAGHKNWLTIKNNSSFYIVSNGNVVQGSAEAYYQDGSPNFKSMPWEYVISPQGVDCTNDRLDYNGYNYYKIYNSGFFAYSSNLKNKSCVYVKIPTNIHLYCGNWAGANGRETTTTNGMNKELISDENSVVATLLPVILTSFEVIQLDDVLNFSWTTASEVNNDYFDIEYSFDGVNYSSLVGTQGHGTTSEEHTYAISVDKSADLQGLLYFRLKQTDFDGNYSYSGVKALYVKSFENENYVIYPRPATKVIFIEGSYDTIRFVDMNNRSVNVLPISDNSFSIENLPVGIYFAIIANGNMTKTEIFVKE